MGSLKPFMPTRTSTCVYCKRGPLIQGEKGGVQAGLTATRDHFVPKASGGGRWYPCCATCNGLKGSIMPTAWLTFIDLNPRYWRTFPDNRTVIRWLLDHNAWRRTQGRRGLPIFAIAPDHFMASINRL